MVNNLPVCIAGYLIQATTREEVEENINARLISSKKTMLFFANTNFVVKCEHLLRFFNDENTLIVNDGLGLDIASILLHGRKFKSNLNGTDFIPYFLSRSKKQLRVFLLGSSNPVLNKTVEYIKRELGHSVVGKCDGYDGIKTSKNLVGLINSTNADIVLVAMGNSKQEEWILANYKQLNARLFVGVGGLFDFWSGEKPRAPIWMQNIRMEWFYRLCLEPRRLYKRYTIEALKFLYICIKYRIRQGKYC